MGRLVLVLLLAALAAGCAGGEGERARSASSDEVGWLTHYTQWRAGIDRAWTRATRVRTDVLNGERPVRAAERAYAPMRRCSTSFEARVGAPPTTRLKRAAGLLRRACVHIRRAARLEVRALTGNPGPVGLELQTRWLKAGELLFLAHERFDALLGDDRPLPRTRAPNATSHVEPTFGRFATSLARQRNSLGRVEVRCWSSRDWRDVSDVVRALDPEAYVHYNGLADRDRRRISLAPYVCKRLADLAYARENPTAGRALLETADAVLTFAHEVEHIVAPWTEAETECQALQDIRLASAILGAPRPYAARLARVAWGELYPENAPEYRTKRCRDGGPLDRNPDSAVWP